MPTDAHRWHICTPSLNVCPGQPWRTGICLTLLALHTPQKISQSARSATAKPMRARGSGNRCAHRCPQTAHLIPPSISTLGNPATQAGICLAFPVPHSTEQISESAQSATTKSMRACGSGNRCAHRCPQIASSLLPSASAGATLARRHLSCALGFHLAKQISESAQSATRSRCTLAEAATDVPTGGTAKFLPTICTAPCTMLRFQNPSCNGGHC